MFGPIILSFQGHTPKLAPDVFVATGATVIGQVTAGPQSSLWFGVVLRGDVQPIRIGARTNVQDNTVIHGTRDRFPVEIGSDVTIGHACLLHACTLDDRAFIGMGALVMDGARVESGAMVAAGALVPPGLTIPAGQLWAGRPARYVRDLTAEEHTAHAELVLHYTRLAAEHRRTF